MNAQDCSGLCVGGREGEGGTHTLLDNRKAAVHRIESQEGGNGTLTDDSLTRYALRSGSAAIE